MEKSFKARAKYLINRNRAYVIIIAEPISPEYLC